LIGKDRAFDELSSIITEYGGWEFLDEEKLVFVRQIAKILASPDDAESTARELQAWNYLTGEEDLACTPGT
jgi:hypothetical protein